MNPLASHSSPPPIRVGVTGASGFIGQTVCALLRAGGMHVTGFSRSPGRLGGVDDARAFATESAPDFSGLDAVIHLAGENLLGLWTKEKKRRIMESRISGTRSVVEALDAAQVRVFLCASAVGFYGNRGDEVLDENSQQGNGFLSQVCAAWEAEAAPAQSPDRRVCILRLGFVLAACRTNRSSGTRGTGASREIGRVAGEGGAMRLLIPLFRSGLGGRVGDGRQWMAPVHVDDAAGLFLHLLRSESASGIFNAVLPEPVTNREFTAEAGRAAHRPAILPVPAFALRLLLGELSQLVLNSTRVRPTRSLAVGYTHKFPDLPAALAAAFGNRE